MTSTVSAIIGGTTYSLSDGSPFYRVALDGRGMAPIRRLTERGPQQNGATDVGFRLDPRRINLLLTAQGTDRADFDDIRDQIYQLFTPSSTALTLRYTRDDGEIRDINVHVVGEMDFPESQQIYGSMTWAVPLEAADPVWYDPTLNRVAMVGGGDSTGLTIPLIVDVDISGETINAVRTVAYTGTFRTYPTITITGPIDDLEITNSSTGDELQFDTSIGDGDTITVDLAYGAKTVVNQSGTNCISYLSSGSDLATWSIEPAPVVASGTNSLRITGTGADSGSSVLIEYYNRYIGV